MAFNQMFSNSQRTLELLAKMFNLSLELDIAPKHWHVAISFKRKKICKVTLWLIWCFRRKKLASYILYICVIKKAVLWCFLEWKNEPRSRVNLTKWCMWRTWEKRETTGGNLCQLLVRTGKIPGLQIHQKIKENAHSLMKRKQTSAREVKLGLFCLCTWKCWRLWSMEKVATVKCIY